MKTKNKSKKNSYAVNVRRPTAYDRGQHELICRALDISPDPNAPGLTAYEGVCIVLGKLDEISSIMTEDMNDKDKLAEIVKVVNRDINADLTENSFIRCY